MCQFGFPVCVEIKELRLTQVVAYSANKYSARSSGMCARFRECEVLTKVYTLFYHPFWQEEVLHGQPISASAAGTDRPGISSGSVDS